MKKRKPATHNKTHPYYIVSTLCFLLDHNSILGGASSNVDASKHSQIVGPEFQRRTQTLDEVTQNDTLYDDHLDEGHDEDHDEDHDANAHDDKPWGEVIVASILINLASLVGLFFLGQISVGREVDEHTGREWGALLKPPTPNPLPVA
jgi:hypothetical protein